MAEMGEAGARGDAASSAKDGRWPVVETPRVVMTSPGLTSVCANARVRAALAVPNWPRGRSAPGADADPWQGGAP